MKGKQQLALPGCCGEAERAALPSRRGHSPRGQQGHRAGTQPRGALLPAPAPLEPAAPSAVGVGAERAPARLSRLQTKTS